MPVWASAFANLLITAIQGTLQADIDGRLAAIQAAVQSTQGLAVDIRNAVLNLALALLNIAAKIDALQNSVNSVSLALLQNGIEQSGQFQSINYQLSHPILPAPGGGGATPSEIWNFRPLMSTRTVGEWLVAAGNLAYFVGFAQARFQSADTGWSVSGQWWDANSPEPNDRWTEAVDITTILPTDATVAAWFERTTGRVDYIVDITGRVGLNQAATSFTWWLDITQADFEILRGITGGTPVPSLGAPVWPGLANVTLGDVLTLTDGMTVDGPLHGVIVNITGVPPPTGFYGFGARKSYVHIGAIVFVSDNGDAEHSETIGLDSQVISVRGMARAASAVLRVKSGTVGTVQPWTITA